MSRRKTDPKADALRAQGCLHPHPEKVTDEAFAAASEFLDARDLVQVKYEMLRRVEAEGQSVTSASSSFGFSRPSFYQAQKALQPPVGRGFERPRAHLGLLENLPRLPVDRNHPQRVVFGLRREVDSIRGHSRRRIRPTPQVARPGDSRFG